MSKSNKSWTWYDKMQVLIFPLCSVCTVFFSYAKMPIPTVLFTIATVASLMTLWFTFLTRRLRKTS